MRVAIVCDWFVKYAAGQAQGLLHAGADVALVCRTHAHEFGGSHEERDALLDGLRQTGVEVIEVPGGVACARDAPGVVLAHRRLRAWRPDLLHAHTNQDPRFLALAMRSPTVLTVHDPVQHPGAPPVGRLRESIRRAWLRTASGIVVHGERLRDELLAACPVHRPVEVIPHGTWPVAEPVAPPATPVISLLGRLEPYKGVDVLVRAMSDVWKARPDVRLIVAGAGPAAADVPIDPRVERRLGYIAERELDALFDRSTIITLPYTQGSQSGVGLLAVGRGLPVVASDVGALPELVCAPGGVVTPGDCAALASALLCALDHSLEDRRGVLRFARDRFGWDSVGARSLAFYDRVLATPVRP